MKLTLHIALNKLFCGKYYKNLESELFEKAKNNIKADMDIHIILDHIKDVDKLKKVIFTDD
jgi:hypothetical protein